MALVVSCVNGSGSVMCAWLCKIISLRSECINQLDKLMERGVISDDQYKELQEYCYNT